MLLAAANPPLNKLLQAGFDLQYITRHGNAFEDVRCLEFFEEQYVEVLIRWETLDGQPSYGSGEVSFLVVRSRSYDRSVFESEGRLTILDPGTRLLGVMLVSDNFEEADIAKLRITYGTCFNDALFDDYVVARKQPRSILAH